MNSEDELLTIVKRNGQLKTFKYQGEDVAFHYLVHFFNEQYIFIFENNEPRRTFKGTFSFVLENLAIEGEAPGATSFKLELPPSASAVRKITRVNPAVESKYKCSYSYSFMPASQPEISVDNAEGDVDKSDGGEGNIMRRPREIDV